MKKNICSPPGIAAWILERMVEKEICYGVLGDMEEQFNAKVKEKGWVKAHFFYWAQILVLLPGFIKNSVGWGITMFKNYLKIALRNVFKQKGYSFINIFGLAIGMAVSILILLWVQHEVGFDKFHSNIDNLYFVGSKISQGDTTRKSPGTPPLLGPALKEDYPDIVNSMRFDSGGIQLLIKYGDKVFIESSVKAADPSFFEMFSFPLVKGDPSKALSDRYSIVLSETMAEKYFGQENPLGQIVRIQDQYDLKVTAVLKNIPRNSTFQFDILVPLLFVYDDLWGKNQLNSWTNSAFFTLVQLNENVSCLQVNEKISNRIKQAGTVNNAEPFLIPFSDLYLKGIGSSGSDHLTMVRLFSLIALFILVIACINYMNLATARSWLRSKEIGMRKVTGASRRNIISQFFGESLVISFISILFALLMVSLLIPEFNRLTEKDLSIDFAKNPVLILGLLGIALFSGITAGSYPALFLSSFNPLKILKGSKKSGPRSPGFRKVLVVFQFVLSIALIIGTVVISRQINFFQKKDLGFSRENLLFFPLNPKILSHSEIAKKEILDHPGVSNLSLTSFTPLGFYSSDDDWNWEGKNPGINTLVSRFCTDHDFLNTFNIKLKQGDFYSPEDFMRPSPVSKKVVINETFADLIGKQNPVGTRLTMGSQNFVVIGTVKNFNFFPLYHDIAPLAIFYQTENTSKDLRRYRYMFAKIEPDRRKGVIEHIKRIFARYSPEFPFSCGFLDEQFGHLYNREKSLGSIVQYFALIAIVISCLGLIGLATYMAEQRSKEIGIRKVMGASVSNIMLLLSKDFVKWVLFANIIAWPIAYLILRSWLQNFAFRITLGIDIFLLSGLVALLISLGTVSYQCFKTAFTNPVEVLKYE